MNREEVEKETTAGDDQRIKASGEQLPAEATKNQGCDRLRRKIGVGIGKSDN